jgi:hypothetical protein
MPPLPNIRRETFARQYLKTGIGSKAYCQAYGRQQADATARVNASRLLTYADINMRLCELRKAAMKRADITIDKILNDYQTALEMAKAQDKPDSIVKAAESQAKLVGLLRDRIETGNAGDFDTMENISDIVEIVRAQAGDQAALAFMKAFNLDKSNDEQALIEAESPTDAVN